MTNNLLPDDPYDFIDWFVRRTADEAIRADRCFDDFRKRLAQAESILNTRTPNKSAEVDLDAGWINPHDRTQKQWLPWIGERVLFQTKSGDVFEGKHGGGSWVKLRGNQYIENSEVVAWAYPKHLATGKGGDDKPEPVYQAGKVRAKFVLQAFDETLDDMTVIKDSPSWRTIRKALVLLDQTEQQKTAEPGDAEKALDWLLVSLDMSHTEWCDTASWRDDFKEKVEIIRAHLESLRGK